MDPYENSPVTDWQSITKRLVDAHPLKGYIVECCLKSWESILNGKINTYLNLLIREMSMSPQAIGALLHDIIPVYIERNSLVTGFRKGSGIEKDVVYEHDDRYSFEIKTSSSRKSIYGNRSYAKSEHGKSKDGYYLTINFDNVGTLKIPKIRLIRFGWLSYSDWKGQASETGQQASLSEDARKNKFVTLHQDA